MNDINEGERHQKNIFVLKMNSSFSIELGSLGKCFCELFLSVVDLFFFSICVM